MTRNKCLLSLDSGSFHPLVTLVDDSISSIQSNNVANATSSLSLSFMHYVSKFPFNLLPISRIIKSLNYAVTLSPHIVYLRNLE